MNNLKEKLKRCDLTENEAQIYTILLKYGTLKVQNISKKANINRTLTYQVLNNLNEKGLINYCIKEGIKYYSISNVNNLSNSLHEKLNYVNSLIPELKVLEVVKQDKQDVQVYEGKTGIKTLIAELLNCKNVDFFGATGELMDLFKFYFPHALKEFENKKISVRAIGDEEKKSYFSKIKNIKFKSLKNVKSYNSPTVVFDDCVALVCFNTEKPITIIIKNEFISKTYKNYFEFMWNLK